MYFYLFSDIVFEFNIHLRKLQSCFHHLTLPSSHSSLFILFHDFSYFPPFPPPPFIYRSFYHPLYTSYLRPSSIHSPLPSSLLSPLIYFSSSPHLFSFSSFPTLLPPFLPSISFPLPPYLRLPSPFPPYLRLPSPFPPI